MMQDLARQLERLGQERTRLEALLAHNPVWRALKALQKDFKAVSNGTPDAPRAQILSRQIEGVKSDLSKDPIYGAHQSVAAAMSVIKGILMDQAALSPAGSSPDHAKTTMALEGHPQSHSDHARPALRRDDLRTLEKNGDKAVTTDTAIIRNGPPAVLPQPAVEKHVSEANHADDLTRIRCIDRGLAAALIARGVSSYVQISQFGPADVRSLAAALGLGRRISSENWIEQAALLAMRAKTATSRKPVPPTRQHADNNTPLQTGLSVYATAASPSIVEVSPVCGGREAAYAERNSVAPDFNDATTASVSNDVPAAIADQVATRHIGSASAGLSDEHKRALEASEATANHGANADWIDETSMETIPAFAALIAASQADTGFFIDEMVRDCALQIAARARQKVVQREIKHAALQSAVTVDLSSQPSAVAVDDLTLIHGIDRDIADVLASLGFTRFAQIAAWDAASVAQVRARLGFNEFLNRYCWIEQAAILARGAETAHAKRARLMSAYSLVPRPDAQPMRDRAFAAWLHARSIVNGKAPDASQNAAFDDRVPAPDAPFKADARQTDAIEFSPSEKEPTGQWQAPDPEQQQYTAQIIPLKPMLERANRSSHQVRNDTRPSPSVGTSMTDEDEPDVVKEFGYGEVEDIPFVEIASESPAAFSIEESRAAQIDEAPDVDTNSTTAADSEVEQHIHMDETASATQPEQAPHDDDKNAVAVDDAHSTADEPPCRYFETDFDALKSTRQELEPQSSRSLDATPTVSADNHIEIKPLSIVDRITAIERAAANLPVPPELAAARTKVPRDKNIDAPAERSQSKPSSTNAKTHARTDPAPSSANAGTGSLAGSENSAPEAGTKSPDPINSATMPNRDNADKRDAPKPGPVSRFLQALRGH